MTESRRISETVVEAFVEQTITSLRLTEAIRHPGEGGRAREETIRRFLKQLMPPRIRLDTGFVIDSRGGISKQIDLIAYRDDYHPVFEIGGIKHIMAEAVAIVVQNKARITRRQDLMSALDNIASVKALDRGGSGFNRVQPGSPFPGPVDPSNFLHQILGIIISQRSMRRDALLTTLHGYLDSTPREIWPNMFVDVNEFDIAYYHDGLKTSTDPTGSNATATRFNGVPLADLAYEVANFLRVAPLIDYPPSAYFGLAEGLGGHVVNRPIGSPASPSA